MSAFISLIIWFKHRVDLVFSKDCAESLFVENNRTMVKSIVIGVIYRPPDCKLRDFILELEELVSVISKENKTLFLMGDWNLNFMNLYCHQATGEFLVLMFSRMFFPLTTRPTRITSHKASLLDNIFTNEPLIINLLAVFLSMTFLIIFRFSLLSLSMNRFSKEISILLFASKNSKI